jgi:tetratricopeptide (TPR) repeat protein
MKRAQGFLIAFLLLASSPSFALTAEQVQKLEDSKKKAAQLISKGNYNQAIPLLKDVLATDPTDKAAARYLAIAEEQAIEPFCSKAAEAYQAEDYEGAISQWRKISGMAPSDVRIEKLIELAKSKMHETSMEAMFALVDRFLAEGNYELAVRELENILMIEPGDKRAQALLTSTKETYLNTRLKEHYAAAEAFMKDKRYDLAITEWEQILRIDANQEAASRLIASARRMKLGPMYDQARTLYREGDYISARDMYHKIAAENPTDQDIKKAIVRLNDTIAVVQKVDGKGPAQEMLRKAFSNYIAPDGNPKASIAAAWYASQIEPDNEMFMAARDLLESKQIAALRTMEPPVRDMNVIDQYLFAALSHIYEGRYDLAIQKCLIVLELQPQNVLALKRLGSAYFVMGKKDKAREAWEKALKLAPEDQELKRFIKQSE